MNSILDVAKRIILDHRLCDNCLGRQFGNLAYNTNNEERGRNLKNTLTFEAHSLALSGNKNGEELLKKLAQNGMSELAMKTLERLGLKIKNMKKKCELCLGKMQEIDKLAELAVEKMRIYEFDTFLVGAKIPEKIIEAEDSLRAEYEIKWGETIKSEFTREIGKVISNRFSKQVEYKRPNITVMISPYENKVALQVNPLFIKGRYRKLLAGISQSKWLCSYCRGEGCQLCSGTGRRYTESVHEIIENFILKASQGTTTEFHGGGREDVDAKVLGGGRPFVIEVKNPKKRFVNLREIERKINKSGKVEVLNLKFAQKDDVRKVKTAEAAHKTYLLDVESEEEITNEDLKKIEETFTDVTINQQTPRRVLRRRADKLRTKHIYNIKIKRTSSKSFELQINCQGGLYVKEVVNGDNGRTIPSIADTLQKKVKCIRLSVLNVDIGVK